MKGLLLRVGIDTGTEDCLAPIFQDRSFEYIPIPETCATSETSVYKIMTGEWGRPLKGFVKENRWYSHPHYDPEFTTYTYGDPARKKRSQLSRLCRGDMLIFYAGLQPMEGRPGKPRTFVIGYFTIEKVYDFREYARSEWERIFNEVPNNAHSKQYQRLKALGIEYDDNDSVNDLVIVRGCRESSKILREALPLGDDNYLPLQDIRPIIGYTGSLMRSAPHSIDENHMQKVKEWLGLRSQTDKKNSRDDVAR